MRKMRRVEDLSVDELRRLLVEKRRAARQGRLERYRHTGRVVTLASDTAMSGAGGLGNADGLATGDLSGEHRPSRTQRVLDRLLLVIEVLAVLALGFVVYSGLDILRDLNHEYAASQVQPTLTPTPLIVAVVLPSGHTPPDAEGHARPNDAEIPEHLRPLVQSMANMPAPTQSVEHALHIQISAIGIHMKPVVQGDGWEQLKKGVGQSAGSANPGEKGNVVLSAHNDIYGEIFRDLDKLQKGDQIVLYTSQRAYTYIVSENPKIVEPTAVEVMAQTPDAVVTLISCYPYLVDNKRIVIRARLQKTGQ
ncbi:MAG: sortase [Chloroflexota bacterium]